MKLTVLSLFLLLTILAAAPASAGSRRFTYVYEVTTSPPGDVDVENWITWKTSKPDDRGFKQVEFRHELEWGITDKFQAAVYLADWNYHRGLSVGERGFTLSGPALECVHSNRRDFREMK